MCTSIWQKCLVANKLSVCCTGPGGLETHAWALMSTVMTEVLSKADWLKLWDHILSNSPPFLMFVLLAYFIFFRGPIMSAETLQEVEGITRRCNPIDLNKVMSRCLHYGQHLAWHQTLPQVQNMSPQTRNTLQLPKSGHL